MGVKRCAQVVNNAYLWTSQVILFIIPFHPSNIHQIKRFLEQSFAAPASAFSAGINILVLVDAIIILNLATVHGVIVVVVTETPMGTSPGVRTGPGTATASIDRGRGTDTAAVAAPALADAKVGLDPTRPAKAGERA